MMKDQSVRGLTEESFLGEVKDALVHKRPDQMLHLITSHVQQIAAQVVISYLDKDSKIAALIDHTLLKSTASRPDITALCHEAKKYEFASVCINPSYVSYAKDCLLGTKVKVCTVIGFPLGANTTDIKIQETKNAVRQGATEIDMVIHQGYVKSQEYLAVFEDIYQVVQVASPCITKVIIETGALSYEEKIIVATLAKLAGAHFVKTSTGFSNGGATIEDVKLLRQIVGHNMGVKASGGIRNLEDLKAMCTVGANRIGTSSSVKIMQSLQNQEDGLRTEGESSHAY